MVAIRDIFFPKHPEWLWDPPKPHIQMGPEYLSLGIAWSERAADQWLPFSVKVKNE